MLPALPTRFQRVEWHSTLTELGVRHSPNRRDDKPCTHNDGDEPGPPCIALRWMSSSQIVVQYPRNYLTKDDKNDTTE